MSSIFSDPRDLDSECFDREQIKLAPEPAPAATERAGHPAGKVLAHAHLLWANRKLLGKAVVAGLAAGALTALLIPSRYESTVQLMPPDTQSNTGIAMLAALAARSPGGLGAAAGDVLGIKSSGALFIGILRSRTVEDRLVERFQLRKVYGDTLNEDARAQLAENTAVSEDRKSGIITLTVFDHDRQRARALAMADVEELNRLVSQLSTSSARRERVFLEGRLAAVRQGLEQATRALAEFSSRNATIDVKEQGRAMLEAAATLQGALIAAESQRQSLEAIYTPNNVRVRAAAAQAAELRKQLDKLGGKAPESEDAAKSDSVYPSLRKFPLLSVQYEDLYLRAKIQEAVFETLTQQYEIAKVQEAKETPTVKMLDEADVPERRSFPPRALITFLSACLTLLVASTSVVVRHHWRQTDTSHPTKQFAEEVFHGVNSLMPWATPNGSRWQAATHHAWTRLTNPKRESPAETHDGSDPA